MTDWVADLLSYIDRSPTPYHAVTESARRLEAAGFRRLLETDAWSSDACSRLTPGAFRREIASM